MTRRPRSVWTWIAIRARIAELIISKYVPRQIYNDSIAESGDTRMNDARTDLWISLRARRLQLHDYL